jgi:hypothetical protein
VSQERSATAAGALTETDALDRTAPITAPAAVDAIERAVGALRAQTVDRARGITTAIVFGLLAACFAIPALFFVMIGLFRVVAALYGAADIGVWAAWVTLGGIFLTLGLLCWALRFPRTAT